MYVSYYAVNDEQIAELKQMDSEEIIDFLEEQDEDENAIYTDIDKAWQGLSYVLTGSDFSDGSVFGEALFGEEIIYEEDYMALISHEKIPKILEALKNVNIQEKIAQTSFEEMTKADIYPDIWYEEDREELTEYLTENFEELLKFYEKIAEQKLGVLVTLG